MFCPNCGTQNDEAKFCKNCGTSLGQSSAPTQEAPAPEEETIIWTGQPAGIKGKAKTAAKVNAGKYTLTSERLIVEFGLIGRKRSEMELFSIKDIGVKQSVAERLQKIGTITIISKDPSDPHLNLQDVENPQDVADLIRAAMQKVRKSMGVQYRLDL